MELPKHTTQVGTIAANKKLYLEDYCISYMKQLGETYPDDRKQIALFGTVEREKSIEYAFAYGAALLGRGKGRTDSLTNSQKEEAESFREEFFPDYQLLGVVIATDQVDENVYWLGNGNKAIPLDGYYIFYDKNEAMLNFMMHNQKEERDIDLDPVIVKKADMDREKREKKEREEQERLEAQKQRAEQKKAGSYRQRIQKAEKVAKPEKRKKRSAFPVAACLLVVAIAGILGAKTYYAEDGGMHQLKTYITGFWDKASVLTGGYLDKDGEEMLAAGTETTEEASAETNTVDTELVVNAEDVVKESITVVTTEVQQPAELDVIVIPEPDAVGNNVAADPNSATENNVAVSGETVTIQTPPQQTTTDQVVIQTQPQEQETQPVATQPMQEQSSQQYLIKKGDSLLRILRKHYGDDSRLAEICDVNGIIDPNNIQVGQTILLP